MERERFEIKVGIFVFVALVALGAIVMLLGARQDMFARQYPLYAEFQEVSGLKPGAPVRLSGVDIGTVEEILFPADGEKLLRVRLMIRNDVRERIRADSKASISTQGVLGDKFVSITLGTEGDPLPKGAMLPSEQPADYLAFLETAGQAMNNIASITKKIDLMMTGDVSAETKQSIAGTLASINDILANVQKGDGLLHKLIYDKEVSKALTSFETTSENLAVITTQMRSGPGAVPALLNDPKGKETVAKLIAAADNMEKSSADLRKIIGRIERGEGTVGALINDDGVYDDLRALLGRAKRNRILRTVIRSTIDKNENLDKGKEPEQPVVEKP